MTTITADLEPMDKNAKVAKIARACGYATPERYIARARFLFEGVDLAGKRVLDIGCGPGAWALWSGLEGASYVLGIEPEASGSTNSTFQRFLSTIHETGMDRIVEGKPDFVQNIEVTEPFDVVVAYDVINHFSESHTETLHLPEAREARDFYIEVFRGLRKMVSTGATLILADVARRNFYGDRGVDVPWTRGICWRIHQDPSVWASLFEQAGFRTIDTRWSYPYPLTWLKLNRTASYFYSSHFVLRVKAV